MNNSNRQCGKDFFLQYVGKYRLWQEKGKFLFYWAQFPQKGSARNLYHLVAEEEKEEEEKEEEKEEEEEGERDINFTPINKSIFLLLGEEKNSHLLFPGNDMLYVFAGCRRQGEKKKKLTKQEIIHPGRVASS